MRPRPLLYLTTLSILLPANPVCAAGKGLLAWPEMSLGLLGGLALFLLGMERLTEALKAVTGPGLRNNLARFTSNRFAGALTGALVTAVIQSSSVTTVLVVGFVSAGLMSLSQSVGVIMGANIGSTITAQIIAFKVVKLALALIASGFALHFFGRREALRCNGNLLLGLGLVFLGMNTMGEAMAPLRNYTPFLDLMTRMAEPLFGILVGAAFTALIQSSAATTGIVIALSGQGLLSLPAGIALALGANVGTCVTAVLATAGKPRAATRAAAVHVLFNLLGVLIWFGFIDQLATLASWISPAHLDLPHNLRPAASVPRQIANAHTLFNLFNALLFLPMAGVFARVVKKLFPDRAPKVSPALIETKFLDSALLDTPAIALNLARLEIGHLGEQIQLMLAQARQAFSRYDEKLFAALEKQDDAADILYGEIIGFLNQIGKRSLNAAESAEYFRLSQAAGNLEGIGDVLETDLNTLGRKMIHDQLQPSPTMFLLLDELHEAVYRALELAVRTIIDNDPHSAREVIALRTEINQRLEAALRRQAESLASSELTRLQTLNAEFELTDKLKRIYTLSKRIARLWAPKQA